MVAGRELDAMMAEKVMGLAPFFDEDHEDYGVEATRIGERRLSFYSTDIAAAWEVVEKLATNGDWDEYPFEIHKNYNFKPTWTATFNDYEHEGWSEVSAAHAICLAALAAVGALPTPQEDGE